MLKVTPLLHTLVSQQNLFNFGYNSGGLWLFCFVFLNYVCYKQLLIWTHVDMESFFPPPCVMVVNLILKAGCVIFDKPTKPLVNIHNAYVWLLLHPYVYTYGPCDVQSGLYLTKKVITCWGGVANTAAPAPVSMCCSDWTCSPACLEAIREWVLQSEAPLESPDWLETHLPNRLEPCH